jgi:hypothetical protein
MQDFSPPLHLLAGLVRNPREAKALVDLDGHAIRYEVALDHLLSCCAQERDLEHLRCTLTLHSRVDASLQTALVLCDNALVNVRRSIDVIVAEVDALLRRVAELSVTLRRYAESNEALAKELEEDRSAPAVAAAKQRLWLVEESLAARSDQLLATMRRRVRQEESSQTHALL